MTKPEGSSNDRKLNVIVLIVIRISSFLKGLTIGVVNVFAPNNENCSLRIIAHREKLVRRFECNLRGFLNRITVSAATYRRKRQCFDFIFHRKQQRIAVAICQRSRFVMFPAAPNRTDCVNDKAGWQKISTRDFSFAGTTTAQRAAFGQQFGACGAVNRAIDAATAEERRVRGVHNGINVQSSDVTAHDLDSAVGILHRAMY
jgi:hypothetical protein